METLKIYLDNMFAAYPSTPETEKLKRELLVTMEDKYLELKASGKSEHSAVGIVISDFGNIEELAEEYGISSTSVVNKDAEPPLLSSDTVEAFLAVSGKRTLCLAIAPSLVIIGISVQFLFMSLKGFNVAAVISVLIGVVACTGLILYGSNLTKPFAQIKMPYNLPVHVRMGVEAKEQQFLKSKAQLTTIGIIITLLSPVWFFIAMGINKTHFSMVFSSIAVMFTIAIGCALLIYSLTMQRSYRKLLHRK